MKILVIGSGGRENALIWKISQSKLVKKIYAIPGNPGVSGLAITKDINPSNIIEIADFAKAEGIDLTIVGPELPLALGIVDTFNKKNLKIFGPSQKASIIESSKAFSKEFMKKNDIPTAAFETFRSAIDAINYLKKSKFPLVIKADGLASGKGVFICQNLDEAQDAIKKTMLENKFGKSGEMVVIEEFVSGPEMSFIVISDGKRVIPLVSSMDYKKIYENDEGPNSGGMGAISPSPDIDKEKFNFIMEKIIYPTIKGMKQVGREFRGVLYAGLILDESGPKVLEFNARFGDPETQAILLRLKSDIIPILEGSADGNLFDVNVEWDSRVSACVVLASKGYPGKFEKDKIINGLERAKLSEVEIFHAGTKLKEDGVYTYGGRVLNICAKGKDLKEAIGSIYDSISFLSFDNIYFRQDIGRSK